MLLQLTDHVSEGFPGSALRHQGRGGGGGGRGGWGGRGRQSEGCGDDGDLDLDQEEPLSAPEHVDPEHHHQPLHQTDPST